MIGMSRVLARRLMCAAVSKPSMPGITTSSRITANSPVSSAFSAASPDLTGTRTWFSEDRIASSAVRFSARSSTSRILGFAVKVTSSLRPGSRLARLTRRGLPGSGALQPAPHDAQQMPGVHRLGDVVGGAGGDGLLPVPLHRLRGHRDDRQVRELWHLPDR